MKRIIIGLFIFMSFMVMHEASADVGKMLATREEIRERGLTKEIAELIHFVEFYNTEKPEDDGSTIIGVLEHTFDFSKNNDGSVMAYVYAGGAYSIDGESGVYRSLDIYFDTHMSLDKNSSSLFQGFSKLIEIYGLEFVDTSLVENMSGMFSGCINLINLDLGHFNTSKVTNMSQMFSGCKSLKNLNISSFNTSSSMDMASMFYDCESLTSLDLKHFNTENVTNMASMFAGCRNLDFLGTQGFNISKVTQMQHMFDGCQTLGRIVINNFDPSNVTDMSYIFNNCSNLIELVFGPYFSEEKEPKSKADNLTNMSHMFAGCTSLKSISVGGISGSKVVDMSGLFKGSKNMTNIDFGEFDTSNVTNMASMFEGVEQLTYLDLSNFNTSNVTNMSKMFDGARSLKTLDLNSFNTSSLTNTERMFANTKNLETINFESAIFDNDAKNANMLLGTNQNLVIFVKDNDAKDFILRSTLGSSFNESNIQLRNTSNDTSSSSSSTKNTGPVDNPKTGILNMGIIFGLFIIASTVYILFKKDKLFKQI